MCSFWVAQSSQEEEEEDKEVFFCFVLFLVKRTTGRALFLSIFIAVCLSVCLSAGLGVRSFSFLSRRSAACGHTRILPLHQPPLLLLLHKLFVPLF
jgi:hypothetical protein